MAAILLMTRAEDLLRLGIAWTNADVLPATPPGVHARLRAGDAASLTLVFPPQSIAESIWRQGLDQSTARLSGSSALEFSLTAGTEVELSVEALLGLLRNGVLVPSASADERHSVLDLPCGLWSTPVARPSTDGAMQSAIATFPPAPSRSPAGDAGLWSAEILSPPGTTLTLRPLRALEDDSMPGVSWPLTGGDRARIVAEGSSNGAEATLSLSALGATVRARLRNTRFCWDQRIALGRDEDIVLVMAGILYPLGHRALSVKTVRRQIAMPNDAVAGLAETDRIVVSEAVRRTSRHDFRFSEVEILDAERLVSSHLSPYAHALPDLLTPKQQERQQAQARFDAAMSEVNAAIAGRPTTASQLADGDFGAISDVARSYIEASNLVAGADAQIKALLVQADRITAGLLRMEKQRSVLAERLIGADGQTDPDIQAQIDELDTRMDEVRQEQNQALAGVNNLRAQVQQDKANLPALQAQVDRDLQRFPSTFDGLLAAGDGNAVSASQAQVDLQRLHAEIAHLGAVSDVPVSFIPGDAAGTPLLWQVRMAHQAGDLMVDMPLIFVADIQHGGDPLVPDFSSLTAPDVQAALAQQWAELSEIATQGAAVDLVQDANPLPGDVHEISSLTLVAAPQEQGFEPKLSGIKVKLPSLRILLPGQDAIVSLIYAAEGGLADIPLLASPPITIDFSDDAGRCGGLAAPRFLADGLSRTLGPLLMEAVPTVGLPDFAALYRETTVLGLSLGALIDAIEGNLASLPYAPQILPILDNGKPVGAMLAWHDLPLKSDGIFVAGPDGSKLNLQVKVTGERSETRCAITNFSLALPAGHPIVTLGFTSLAMTQHTDRMPDVEVDGFSFALSGELSLIATLQDYVKQFLDDNAPGIVVKQTPTGISASYGFCLPDVTAGVFQMRNIAVAIAVDIPFSRNPVTISVGFATPDNPFTLGVMVFGGGGYFLIRMGRSGVDRIELSFDFGAFVAMNFAVASGEVHAFGAVRVIGGAGGTSLQASIRIGGSVEVLGLIGFSIELALMLTYSSEGNKLSGRATLVIEVDILFLSRSVQFDTGEIAFAGPSVSHRFAASALTDATLAAGSTETARDQWLAYREAFA